MHARFRLLVYALFVAVALTGSWSAPVPAQSKGRTPAEREVLRKQVIYLVLTDRFFNGDPSNDALDAPGENDPSRKDLSKFHGGDVVGVAKKLAYLTDLGVNTIWITPVYKQVTRAIMPKEISGTAYHGYWPDFTDPDDGKMDRRFGTKQELANLIAGLHKAKMRFLLDKVVNHAGYGARIVKQHPDWFHREIKGNTDIETSPLSGLPDFKQEQKEVANYLTQMGRRWVKEFVIDGVRMDTAKHVPLDYFRKDWIPAVRGERPKLFLLAEVTGGNGEFASVGVLKKFLDAGFDSAFNFWLRDALAKCPGKNESLDGVAGVVSETWTKLGQDNALLLCNLLDNHDTGRFTNEAGFGVSEDEIRRRYHAALVLLFTLPGIPQLYYGNELGMYGEHDGDRSRRSMPDWAWTAADRQKPRAQRDSTDPRLCLPEPNATYTWCRDLIALRGANPALYNGSYVELWRPNGGQNAYAFFRGDGNSRVVVVVNESDQPFSPKGGLAVRDNGNFRQADKDAFKEGAVLERLFDQNFAPATLRVSGGNIVLTLPARSIGVYRLKA